MTGLNAEDGIARWRRIAEHLEGEIASGRLAGQLPTETELAARFGANRHTVRRAIAALASHGLVQAERGRGTFIKAEPAKRLLYPVGRTTRFSENMGAAAKEPGGRLIGSYREPASLELAERLGCRPGDMLIRMELLRIADGAPLLVTTTWFSDARCAGIVAAYAETGTISGALARCGIETYRRSETRVTAEGATAEDADRLSITRGDPILVTLSLNVDLEGRPIQTARTRFAAGRIELVFREP